MEYKMMSWKGGNDAILTFPRAKKVRFARLNIEYQKTSTYSYNLWQRCVEPEILPKEVSEVLRFGISTFSGWNQEESVRLGVCALQKLEFGHQSSNFVN